eukprot:gnl/TRDRNA2_/TRDRNA2_39336_c0_seq1.p1 gnl/TRDRNA2_/TRDRNA2_39336_c0~~gnl/TRDRNA2_/TRDRNA2_39336_c0_seq1.p1  ORF type:complete len:159 (-),score=12.43 gnl/TRDRNA2_/TRDRNA2_39336_c0_seq1:178-654(-)
MAQDTRQQDDPFGREQGPYYPRYPQYQLTPHGNQDSVRSDGYDPWTGRSSIDSDDRDDQDQRDRFRYHSIQEDRMDDSAPPDLEALRLRNLSAQRLPLSLKPQPFSPHPNVPRLNIGRNAPPTKGNRSKFTSSEKANGPPPEKRQSICDNMDGACTIL